ncbi:MAG: DUF2252 domain-containing protein [Corynebacteriales bacterium]|nr:DUF2252 domain-containing protein [Mycobacteriales bacterium]
MSDSARAGQIIDVFQDAFGVLAAADPGAFHRKFRKMANTPFAFYRGSACLFDYDIVGEPDPFVNERTGRVWVHGDLHAENFGTYMNSKGVLVFNVNDFDEAYVGPFTWDVKRFSASLALIGYAKAISDEAISELVRTYANAYITELRAIATGGDDAIGELTLDTTHGVLHDVLQQARLNTRVDMLNKQTSVENYDRKFAMQDGVFTVDEDTRERVTDAFRDYITTLPESNTFSVDSLHVKDIVLRKGVGIGSAGLPSYNVLLEGPTQALENDIIIYLKQGQTPAAARHITDERITNYFHHQGHRTTESQRALQAHADHWGGFTTLDGVGLMAAEVSPYAADLDWDEVNEPEELLEVVAELGRATARMHSVADDDSSHDLVDFSTETEIVRAIEKDEAGFVDMLVDFAHSYGARARADHQIFVDLNRNNELKLH